MIKNKPALVLSLRELKQKRKKFKNVALVGGVFDIIHPGHIRQLKQAKLICDTLIVHVTGDKRAKEKKGVGRPILSEKERAEIVSAIRFVDYVFILNGKHYDQKIINVLRPNILIFHEEAFNDQVKEFVRNLKNFSGRVITTRDKKNQSSSNIIKKLSLIKN